MSITLSPIELFNLPVFDTMTGSVSYRLPQTAPRLFARTKTPKLSSRELLSAFSKASRNLLRKQTPNWLLAAAVAATIVSAVCLHERQLNNQVVPTVMVGISNLPTATTLVSEPLSFTSSFKELPGDTVSQNVGPTPALPAAMPSPLVEKYVEAATTRFDKGDTYHGVANLGNAVYHLINDRGADKKTKQLASDLNQMAIAKADQVHLSPASHIVRLTQSTRAYFDLWGIGTKRDYHAAYSHAQQAGAKGRKFITYMKARGLDGATG